MLILLIVIVVKPPLPKTRWTDMLKLVIKRCFYVNSVKQLMKNEK